MATIIMIGDDMHDCIVRMTREELVGTFSVESFNNGKEATPLIMAAQMEALQRALGRVQLAATTLEKAANKESA